jgi:RHS repeat-associated protein
LSYDFANQLRQAVVPSGASRGLVGTHTYRYDALGRRVAKVVDTNADNTPDTTTVCIYNARWQFIAEYAGGASPTSPTRSRVYSAGYIDEPLAQVEHTGTNAGTYYLHRDKQYCLIGLTNASGAIVETYTYTPYGQRIVRDASFANPTTTSSYAQHLGHQGLMHDEVVDLIHNRARTLHPRLARFCQRDLLLRPPETPSDDIDMCQGRQHRRDCSCAIIRRSGSALGRLHHRHNARLDGRRQAGPCVNQPGQLGVGCGTRCVVSCGRIGGMCRILRRFCIPASDF